MIGERYKCVGSTKVSPELRQLCERRVRPFLDTMGTSTRSLEFLMCEAYLQGIKDAVDAMESRSPDPPPSSV